MKYIVPISLISSLSLFASTNAINISKKAITVTNATTLSKALNIAKRLSKYDIYIYKTEQTKVSYFIIYAININKDTKYLKLKDIKKDFHDAYLSSDKRIKTLSSHNFEKNIFIKNKYKNIITKKKIHTPVVKVTTQNIRKDIVSSESLTKHTKTIKKDSSLWIDKTKESITLHTPIFYGEANYLAKKYKYYDTFIYNGEYNFTVCIVNINKKELKPLLKRIKKDIPTAKLTQKNLIEYFHTKQSSTKSLFTAALDKPQNYKIKKIDNKLFLHAKKEFNNKNYKKAIIFLTDFINQNNSHIEANFLLGRAYYLMNMYEHALATYQKVLIINENLPRVKLELAQTYLALNMSEDALLEFKNILSFNNTPKNVQNSIKKRIKQIKSQNKNYHLNYMFAINWLKDNNINNTTSQNEYEIFAPIFNSYLTLYTDEIAQDKSKTYLFGINYKYKLLDYFITETSFLKSSQKFEEYKDKNSDTILLTNYLTKATKKDKIGIGIEVSKNKLNNLDYQKTMGIGFNYQNKLSPKTIGTLNFKLFKKTFYDQLDNEKESNNISLTLGQIIRTKKFGNININLLATKEEKLRGTRTDIDNSSYGLVLANTYQFNKYFTTILSASSIKKDYSLKDINFLNKREDTTNTKSLTLNYSLYKNLSTTFNISNIDTKSNQIPYDYEKTTHNIGLMYTF